MSIVTTCTSITMIMERSSFSGAKHDIDSLLAASTSTTDTATLSLLVKLRASKTSELGQKQKVHQNPSKGKRHRLPP